MGYVRFTGLRMDLGDKQHNLNKIKQSCQATLETGGVLKLEVCENFSWAEDVERSYSE